MPPEPTPEPLLTCAYSGEKLPMSGMVQIGEHWIGEGHKDACVQYLQQGGELPVPILAGAVTAPPLRLWPIWTEAWRLWKGAFGVMLLLHLVIWVPGDLLIAWMDENVFYEDDAQAIGRSFRFAMTVQFWIGIIAEAGSYHALGVVWRGGRPTFGAALGAGFRFWPRMWLLSFLYRLGVTFGIILLIVPGIILWIRFTFASCYAVDDGRKATVSLSTSYRLTKGHFWRIFGYTMLTGIIAVAVTIPIALLQFLLPEHWDTWQFGGLLTWLSEVPLLYITAVTYVLWQSLRQHAISQGQSLA